MPTAPVPAKTSMKREPSIAGPRTLKNVSRKRSLVGRSLSTRAFQYAAAIFSGDHTHDLFDSNVCDKSRSELAYEKQIPLCVPRPPDCGGQEKRATPFGMTSAAI